MIYKLNEVAEIIIKEINDTHGVLFAQSLKGLSFDGELTEIKIGIETNYNLFACDTLLLENLVHGKVDEMIADYMSDSKLPQFLVVDYEKTLEVLNHGELTPLDLVLSEKNSDIDIVENTHDYIDTFVVGYATYILLEKNK